MTKLTAQRLRELLHYDPETGDFRWLVSIRRTRAGDKAGHLATTGYWLIKIDQFKFPAHRLAYLYMTGEHPEYLIDHRNRVRHDNRWLNLRNATQKQNQENREDHDMRGIRWEEDRQKWLVRIKHHGVTKNLGRFSDLETAIKVRKEVERNTFTHSQVCEPLGGSPDSLGQQDGTSSGTPSP